MYAVAAAALLVAAAVVIGHAVERRDGTLRVSRPPLYANWLPHVGPGTPAAVAVAVLIVAYGPPLAARLPWRGLLGATYAAASAWVWSLALIDGWHWGIARRLTTKYEYLQVIDRFQNIPEALRGFTGHILADSPAPWPAHTAGHPPAAPLTFVLLDRIGLGGGGWAGVWCLVVGATSCVAVLVTVRALAGEQLARRAAPFLALAPAAVWAGTSADGYFAAVAAWSLALLALSVTTDRGRRTAACAAGLLFGLTCYLSYGLTLIAVIGAAVLLLGRLGARLRVLPYAVLGLAVVPALFTAYGFNWWEGYRLLVERYYQGAAGVRPYVYWVWANLACTVLVVGFATVAGLRRGRGALGLLLAGALLALLIADLSGMSKAETERIWLPFATWLLAAGAFLPRARPWLAVQGVLALTVNHLLLTGW
ncbi:hypothetical protein QIS96_00085 [Streptomyces sp. B-S-A6]|uniref:Integral membrane protein n=1 Tax=Streptomyces cavernicola TaxID=3043613 RepID=A0ABT6S2B0_9ACTN|nr:hypothetical protein [Streptomyces sp. B-S-A6]MDI3402237.1 hypothetical protein [Streptomyces sp. B-S-A6]